jgi:hypothetical protein
MCQKISASKLKILIYKWKEHVKFKINFSSKQIINFKTVICYYSFKNISPNSDSTNIYYHKQQQIFFTDKNNLLNQTKLFTIISNLFKIMTWIHIS